ncbi:MAG TPA: tRNA 2-thiouridine(34) synthase MnmA [Acidimicrobiales bacterium]|nr:tRNA 2-thiouridine(34) synthase MnmA [Acidimicrobiales bacterium]
MVAMSGGVDSSVAAALLLEAGHEVVGVTMKLWGGDSDRGCCSVSDVDDARRVAQQLGIDHAVFNFGDDFMRDVVTPYVEAHRSGSTPNPCIECNRHVKFARLLDRADRLGFDCVATGHHARVAQRADGTMRLQRGADRDKDQSYVLHMLGQRELRRVRLPVGELEKRAVRERAAALGLRTAAKPDSQDVCFITATGGRREFLSARMPLHPGRVIDAAGTRVGDVDAVELVTIGQRRGLGALGAERSFAVSVDVPSATVTIGRAEDLLTDRQPLAELSFVGAPAEGDVLAQCSAHGEPRHARLDGDMLTWATPQRRVAPGQSVAFYALDDTELLGGATAA